MFPLIYRNTYATPVEHQPPLARNLADDVSYPNMNSTDYAARPENYTLRLHDCWDSITRNREDGHMALATNKRDGCEWWGSFFGFDQIEEFSLEKAKYSRHSSELISKIQYASNNILLVALTDGRLQAWSTYSTARSATKPYTLYLIGDRNVHLDAINNLTTFRAKPDQVLTTCQELKLTIWDISSADVMPIHQIKQAHNMEITGVDTSYNTDTIFATCGRDGEAKLWDLRQVRPATSLYQDAQLMFTALAWATPTEIDADNIIYLGDYDGKLHTLDIRAPQQLLHSEDYFKDAIVTQIITESSSLAVIGNRPASVKITKAADHEVIYESNSTDDTHQISDGIWTDAQTLLTVGHGCKRQLHKIDA